MTRSAWANARASVVLLSYSCGSALGSVTTLWTWTRAPPSWVAMLPQKFSPATTLSEPACAVEGPLPQAAPVATSPNHAITTRYIRIAQQYCTNDLRNWHASGAMIVVVPRPSPVSDAVRDVFHGHARHAWSIDQLHEAVCGGLGAADYSSVFRAVTTMEREGAIRRIDVRGGKAYYGVGEEHHEHVRCDSCGRVAEVQGGVLDDATAGGQQGTGSGVMSTQQEVGGVRRG